MRIRADEHVSMEIVRAVREMALSPTWELTQVIEVGDRGSTDEHWVTKFAREGGHAVLSGDTDFFKRHQLVLAVNRTGMRIIHMPSRWSNARCELQAAHILLWWQRIEKTIGSMAQRECYRPPWNLSEDGALTKISINFQDSDRHAKRAAARSKRSSPPDNVRTLPTKKRTP